MPDKRITVDEIARHVGARVEGDGDLILQGLGSLGKAQPGELSHLSSPAYRQDLANTKAGAVILKEEDLGDCPVTSIVADNPYLAFARASQLFAPDHTLAGGIHPSAVIDASTEVHTSARIGPGVTIGADTKVGENVCIYPGVSVGNRCYLAESVVLHSNCTIYSDVTMGARTEVHSGAVIGAAGFGYTPAEDGRLEEIAQLGGVTIGSDVSIGACTTIDCGAIDDTVVEDGVKIDNQCQVGHNCHIGAHSMLCGMVGLAGSTRLGRHNVFAGGAGAGGDRPVETCDGVMVSARTVITQSVDKPGIYSGTILFHEHSKWRRNALRFTGLDELFRRVGKLERGQE